MPRIHRGYVPSRIGVLGCIGPGNLRLDTYLSGGIRPNPLHTALSAPSLMPRRTPHLCLVTPARLNPARRPATSLRSPATSLRPCSPAANDVDPGSSHADPSSSELADSRSPASRRPPRPLPARRRGPASRLPVRPPPLPSSALLPAPRCSLQQRGKRVEGPVVEDGKGWGGGGNRKGRVRWGREVEE